VLENGVTLKVLVEMATTSFLTLC